MCSLANLGGTSARVTGGWSVAGAWAVCHEAVCYEDGTAGVVSRVVERSLCVLASAGLVFSAGPVVAQPTVTMPACGAVMPFVLGAPYSQAQPKQPSDSDTPTAPQNLRADVADGQIELTWEAPTSPGRSAIRHYEYDVDGDRHTSVGSVFRANVGGLTNGTRYNFRVRAVNNEGPGAWATVAAAATAAPPPPQMPYLTFKERSRFGIDPTLFQFGSHVFFRDPPSGTDDDTEIDPFPNGRLAADLQLAGGDIVHYVAEGRLRYGGNFGLGPTVSGDDAVMIFTASFFVQIHEAFRINAGIAYARSSDPTSTSSLKDRNAWFVGVSFPTKINDLFRR